MEIRLDSEYISLPDELYGLSRTPQPSQKLTFEIFAKVLYDACEKIKENYVNKAEALVVAHYNAVVHHDHYVQSFEEKAEKLEAIQLVATQTNPNADKLIQEGLIAIDIAIKQVQLASDQVITISQQMEENSKKKQDFQFFAEYLLKNMNELYNNLTVSSFPETLRASHELFLIPSEAVEITTKTEAKPRRCSMEVITGIRGRSISVSL